MRCTHDPLVATLLVAAALVPWLSRDEVRYALRR